MTMIEIAALENGSHRNQTSDSMTLLDGWAVIPEDMEIPSTFPFVTVTAVDGIVTSMTSGVMPEPEPAPEEDSTLTDLIDMTIDQEVRITMLELGLADSEI